MDMSPQDKGREDETLGRGGQKESWLSVGRGEIRNYFLLL